MNKNRKDILIIFLLVLALSPVIYAIPLFVGGSSKIFIVLSESMVPVMNIGDAVIVNSVESKDIKAGNIIAFLPSDSAKTSVSHRVIEVYNDDNGDISFQTKGDAVEDKDPFIVKSENVIGKIDFLVPNIGYLTRYSKKPILFIIFVIIPALLIVVDEMRNMMKSPIQSRRDDINKKKEGRLGVILSYKRFAIVIIAGIVLSFYTPYIRYEFWINFSDINPYILSVMSYIVIQSIVMITFSSVWLKRRVKRKRGVLNRIKKELCVVRRAIF